MSSGAARLTHDDLLPGAVYGDRDERGEMG